MVHGGSSAWNNVNWNSASGGYESYGSSYSGNWTSSDWGAYTFGGYYDVTTTWPAPPALGTMVYTNSWYWSCPDGQGGTIGDTNGSAEVYPDIPQPGGYPWRYAQTHQVETYNSSDSDPDGQWSWTNSWSWSASDSTRTHIDLHTGGPTNSIEQTVFQLTVSAWNMETWEAIDPTLIQIRTNNADTNGVIVVSLTDNSIYDVTPTLPAAYSNYYFYIYPAVVTHQVTLTFNGKHDGTNMFWVNNDVDILHEVDSGTDRTWEYDDDQSGPSDYSYNFVHTLRDLEDFFPLRIELPQDGTDTTNWTCTLKSPGLIKVFFNPGPSESDYLKVTNVANMIVPKTGLYLGDGISITLPMAMFLTNNLVAKLLVEAGGMADGYLSVEFRQDGLLMARDRVRLRILDIKDFYERWTVGNSPSSGVNLALVPSPTAYSVGVVKPVQPWEDDNFILLVHGWNMPVWEKERYAETAFKRLWWEGFRGRLGLFEWPTFYFDNFFDKIDVRNFDTSEHNAWRSAEGLKGLLVNLNTRYPGKVRVMAHSMGNVVTGEALRLAGANQIVHTYVASQAALPANAYDPAIYAPGVPYTPSVRDIYGTYHPFDATDTISACYFDATKYSGAGAFVNYYNPVDWALVGSNLSQPTWLLNQSLKPDGGMGYHYSSPSSSHPSGFYRYWGSEAYMVTDFYFPNDTYQIFAFCGQSHTQALGAQPGVSGKFGGNGLDLNAAFLFGDKHKGHSAQFRSTYSDRWPYWSLLLTDFGIPH